MRVPQGKQRTISSSKDESTSSNNENQQSEEKEIEKMDQNNNAVASASDSSSHSIKLRDAFPIQQIQKSHDYPPAQDKAHHHNQKPELVGLFQPRK